MIPVNPGDQFGDWTVLRISQPERKQNNSLVYYFRCKCGLEKAIRISRVRSGETKGCIRCHNAKKKILIEPGTVFGSWTVIGPSDPPKTRLGNYRYDCRCKCGHERSQTGSQLTRGRTKQCKRCSNKEHTPESRVASLAALKVIREAKRIKVNPGDVFGSWTVIEAVRDERTGLLMYRCRCKCQRIRKIGAHGLRSGKRLQCLNCHVRAIHEIEKLEGRIFGRWTVIRRIPPEERTRVNHSWLCRCECGRERAMSTPDIKQEGGCRACSGKDRRLQPYEFIYRTIRNRILRRYDRTKTQEFTISYEQFLVLVNTGKCHYCWMPIEWLKHGGTNCNRHNAHYMDRKDNSLGYIPGNVVACCTKCNRGKGATYSYEQWWQMTACYRQITKPKVRQTLSEQLQLCFSAAGAYA